METDKGEGNPAQHLVTANLTCYTADAKYLCILDPAYKLETKGEYDIGGTYCDGAEFWFMFKIQPCLSDNYLMSVFVCNRRPASFTLSIANARCLTQAPKINDWNADKLFIQYDGAPDVYDFYKLPQDTFSFVKTFCFLKNDLTILQDKDLLIEMSIDATVLHISQEIIDNVKLSHNFKMMLNDAETSDLVLESSDEHNFSVHKIVLSANSRVLRKMVVDSPKHLKLTESASDIENLVEFMYSGAIQNLNNLDCFSLMDMGVKYDIRGLTQLSQHTLMQHLSVEKAVDILLLAHTHQLSMLQKEVFKFIHQHPAVFQSKAWAELKDVEVTKGLFQYISGGN